MATQARVKASVDVEKDETSRMIASNKVEGTEVYNLAGDHLGEVYNFMVDKFTGQVAYAVMSFGGFLGIGERYHALPWSALDYDTRQGGYVVDLDRSKLERAPSFARDEDPWTDPAYAGDIDRYWTPPL
jgi:sporulation protein YlmC with PRC-barrel domain